MGGQAAGAPEERGKETWHCFHAITHIIRKSENLEIDL